MLYISLRFEYGRVVKNVCVGCFIMNIYVVPILKFKLILSVHDDETHVLFKVNAKHLVNVVTQTVWFVIS